jgi:hypothetical protein
MNETTRRLLCVRGLRAFGDGCISLLLPVYLITLGFTPLMVGVITTATLLDPRRSCCSSACMHRASRRGACSCRRPGS